MVTSPIGHQIPELEAVRRNREELLQAQQLVERALATPAAGPGWGERFARRIAELRDAFAAHVQVTEGADGLYAGILDRAPRLAHSVDKLVHDHAAIAVSIDALCQRATTADPQWVRRWASDLTRQMSRHRQRGADLLYEAYATDIGGET